MFVDTGSPSWDAESHSHPSLFSQPLPQSQSHLLSHLQLQSLPAVEREAREAKNSVYDKNARLDRYARYWVRSAGAPKGAGRALVALLGF